MLAVCIAYMFSYSILSLGFIFTGSRMKKKDILFLILFLISLLYISMNCIPSKTDDLYRHYDLIKKIREWKFDLADTFTVYSGQFLPVWGFSLYCLSFLPHYFWLIVLYVGVTFLSLLGAILLFYKKRLRRAELSLFLFFFFAVNSLFSINSGIRNQCVFGIGTLALYLYMAGKVKFVFLIPVYILLGFIHPAAYLIPLCYVISRLIQGYKWILLLWAPLIKYMILPVFNRLFAEISYLTSILQKLNYYFYERKYETDIRQLAAVILLLAVMLYVNMAVKNSSLFEKDFYHKYLLFYRLILIITIGSAGTTVFLRFAYIAGWFSLPSFMVFIRNCRKNKFLLLLAMIAVCLMLNLYNGITLVTYTEFGLM